jgi:hypothetical protein
MADQVDRTLEVVITEFRCVRDEINQRASYCHTLISINILASGTLAGLAINNQTLLLLLPILNPTLGLLWLDHSYAIRNMGNYIETEITPAISGIVQSDPKLLQWETYLKEHQSSSVGRLLRWLPLGVPILVMFSVVPLFALVQSFAQIGVDAKGVLWVAGFFLTVAFFALWRILIFAPDALGHRITNSIPSKRSEHA